MTDQIRICQNCKGKWNYLRDACDKCSPLVMEFNVGHGDKKAVTLEPHKKESPSELGLVAGRLQRQDEMIADLQKLIKRWEQG